MGTVRKLIVEVIEARNLTPKDGHGTSSPYVVIDYYGQRKKTRTAVRDLNPTWNEVLEFHVGKPSQVFGDELEVDVYHDKTYGPTRRHNFLGRIRLNSSQFVQKGEEALVYYPLEKKNLLSWIQGDIGLKVYYVDEVVPPSQPPAQEGPPATPPTEAPNPENTPPAQDNATAEPGKAEEPAAKPEDQPTPPPPENAAPQNLENDLGQEQAPPENAAPPPVETEPPEAPPSMKAQDDIVLEPTSEWIPTPQELKKTVSMSEFRVRGMSGIPPAQPISRAASVASYMSDASSETMSMERTSFDLVEKMHYLFVRVVKARSLPTNGRPTVKIAVSSSRVQSKPARKTQFFEWDETFAFGREAPDSSSSSIMEISVWDHSPPEDTNFLGGICFDVSEIPTRDPPDSPLAPQWYRLEGGGAHHGDLMLATWVGTQADDSFPDAWKTDTAGNVNSKAKVYVSPKLWYLRATVLEAQDVVVPLSMKDMSFQVKAQLGFQVQKTRISVTRSGNNNPSWTNEDLIFVAAEPLNNHLVFMLEFRQSKGVVPIGMTAIPLGVIERRIDDRNVASRWFNLEELCDDEKRVYKGRVHLRLCFDGGYHVMDEAAHLCSDYRPTARQLWKPSIGTVELGIIGCKNLLPMKAVNGKGSTDAYCVAKYGTKWVRTRTVCDSLEPKWNEQYTWKVYDPCTVLTVGVFDSWGMLESDGGDHAMSRPDRHIGKVRIRISTLQTGKVYKNTYPLIVLSTTGVKKMGEVEVAIRFVKNSPTLDFLHVYSQPLLPLMHHIKPIGIALQDMLRNNAVKIITVHLSRSEPPLKPEVVTYMLDADSHSFSMRKVRANWYRIINVIAGVIDIVKWIDDTRTWKNPTATILVHALVMMLVWFPDLIIPTLAFYVFVIGAWNYRFRSKDPLPHFDPKISLADNADREELDEEFDTLPSTRSPDMVRARYDRLRTFGARVQTVLGDFAAQGERAQALVTWRDPRATGIFVGLCFVVALILYLVPSKMVAVASGFYYFRHPIFRDRMPSPALNFFRRLPSLSDRIM